MNGIQAGIHRKHYFKILSIVFYVVTVVLALNQTKPDILFSGTHELVRAQVRTLLAAFNLVTRLVTLKTLFLNLTP